MSRLESAGRRLWFGANPVVRKSRFHTQKEQFALSSLADAADCLAALATGVGRKGAGLRPVLPWITFPAIRFLRARVRQDTRVFEWGCGMSTLWYERRCGEVWAVEDDPAWGRIVAKRATRAKVVMAQDRAYVEKILEFPAGCFDVVSVDGSRRLECFRLALEHMRAGGLLVIDNSDSDRTSRGDLFVIDQMVDKLGTGWAIHRFPGWAPCNFYPSETTVCVRK